MMPGGPGGNPQYPGMQPGGYPTMSQGNPQMMVPSGQMMNSHMMPGPGMQTHMIPQMHMQQVYMTNPFMNPGAFMPMQGQGGFMPPNQGGRFAPPGYHPQMAQDYMAKQGKEQKMFEQQKLRAEQAVKQRRIQEQQKRLKEFSAIGGRKMDADSLIESIIGPKSGAAKAPGPPGPAHATGSPGMPPPTYTLAVQQLAAQSTNGMPMPAGPGAPGTGIPGHGVLGQGVPANNVVAGQPNMNLAPVAAPDDDFSDFKAGPSTQRMAAGQPSQGGERASGAAQPPPASIPPTAANQKQDKKDLMSMMMECSDLSKPKEARGFRKPKVNEVQVAPRQASSFQASQKSRQWAASSGELTELFQLPPGVVNAGHPKGEASSHEFVYPAWVTGQKPVPDVYYHVLEASIRDGKIDTDVVYPLLMRSNLPREILGHIWSISNKQTPGQLIKEELFLVLAMISVAQNNLSWQNLDILNRCPQAPVPNLGQGPPPPPPGSQTGPVDTAASQTPPTYSQAPHQQPMQVAGTAVPHPPVDAAPTLGSPAAPGGPPAAPGGEDDFADFQTAPTPAAPVTGPDRGFTAIPPPTLNVPNTAQLKPADKSLMSEDDKYSVFKTVTKTLETNMDTVDDDFDDFKSVDSSTTSSGLGDIMPPGMPGGSPAHSATGIPPPPSLPPPAIGSLTISSPAGAGKSSISNSSSADFAEFQAGPISSDTTSDKYSALKAMIMDSALYTTPKEENESSSSIAENKPPSDGDDWAGFREAGGQGGGTAALAAQNGLPPSANDSKHDVFHSGSVATDFSSSQAGPAAEDGWAAFSSAPSAPSPVDSWASSGGAKAGSSSVGALGKGVGKTDYSNDIISDDDFFKQVGGDGGGKAGADSRPTTTAMFESRTASSAPAARAGVNKKKAFGLFARNLEIAAPAAGTGMSPLDITPPDMPPELPPDDASAAPEFDKFGIPASGLADDPPGHGISSLAAPYGDLDDFGDFAMPKTTHSSGNPNRQYNLGPLKAKEAKDTSDSQSVSSLEFTGWSPQEKAAMASREDAKSTHSLELRAQPGVPGSVDSSPAGGDNQSVSSLEFPGAGEPGRKSLMPQDSRSVSSLELKPTEVATETSGSDTPEGGDDFGDFNSATAKNNSEPTLDYSLKPRDASELITQDGMFGATLGDRYSGLSAQPQDSDRHIYDWTRCLNKCCEMIREANNMLNSVSSSIVCHEVIASEQGIDHLQGVVEIYRVACRIKQSMKSASVSNARLHSALQDLEMAWDCLKTFISSSKIMPSASMLDFSCGALKAEQEGAQQRACGICLMDVDVRAQRNGQADGADTKLAYSGREYHSACANFWVNCVDSTLPSLKIPELL